jgi:hypothetical protein
LDWAAKGAFKDTGAVEDDDGAILMALEVLALTPSELSLTAAFPTERTSGRAGLDTVKSRQRRSINLSKSTDCTSRIPSSELGVSGPNTSSASFGAVASSARFIKIKQNKK